MKRRTFEAVMFGSYKWKTETLTFFQHELFRIIFIMTDLIALQKSPIIPAVLAYDLS